MRLISTDTIQKNKFHSNSKVGGRYEHRGVRTITMPERQLRAVAARGENCPMRLSIFLRSPHSFLISNPFRANGFENEALSRRAHPFVRPDRDVAAPDTRKNNVVEPLSLFLIRCAHQTRSFEPASNAARSRVPTVVVCTVVGQEGRRAQEFSIERYVRYEHSYSYSYRHVLVLVPLLP